VLLLRRNDTGHQATVLTGYHVGYRIYNIIPLLLVI
jgi:hypothetical protein